MPKRLRISMIHLDNLNEINLRSMKIIFVYSENMFFLSILVCSRFITKELIVVILTLPTFRRL